MLEHPKQVGLGNRGEGRAEVKEAQKGTEQRVKVSRRKREGGNEGEESGKGVKLNNIQKKVPASDEPSLWKCAYLVTIGDIDTFTDAAMAFMSEFLRPRGRRSFGFAATPPL